ncbi:MAG: polymer-forming cytoskeletal protein [Acidobacteria bacterium]|nr:polymer-forming cytoskeletal protein [Acidobacteriota bacterium]
MMKFGKSSSNITTSNAPVSDLKGFLGDGTEIKGELSFSEMLRVDGSISGKIKSDSGTLLVGERGYIKASVEAANVSVSGTIEGTVTAKNKVEIHPTGKVFGDVYTQALIIEHGAVFDGKCHMTGREIPAKTEPVEK